MKITMIGTGYVGLVTGTCFADMGNDVWCVDVDEKKIASLKEGHIPIYEQGLQEIVERNRENQQLFFTTDLSLALAQCDICFIAVGTPMKEDGSADLNYVLSVAKEIGETMVHHMYIIDKSTVPVGTAQKVKETVQQALTRRGSDLTFDVISNPEFLKEGTAISDCMKPDRIVIGLEESREATVKEIMLELYQPYVRNHDNFIFMDIASAEMTKYAANAMLATKISFMNEMAQICEKVGADINRVRKGIGSDVRIGYHFIYPGCGYGGSCFPKDVQALIKTAEENQYTPHLLQAVEQVNETQKMVLSEKIKLHFQDREIQKQKVIALWGLSFKPDTDDMRKAPSLTLIEQLLQEGIKVQVYDPKAMDLAKEYYLHHYTQAQLEYFPNKYDALEGAHGMVLVTDWKEFRSPDFYEMKKRLLEPVIFDGRNQYQGSNIKKYGFTYYQIGVNPLYPEGEGEAYESKK